MTEEEIKFLLSEDNNEVLDAHREIVSMQRNKDSVLKLGESWIDDNLIAGLNNKICFFGGRPSNGKTYHCSQTINALLNRELNPMPVKVARFNLEMPTQSLMLQEISKVLKRDLKDILSRPYTDEEKPTVRNIIGSFMDKRVKNISKVLKAEDFKQFMLAFLKEIDDEDALINEEKLNTLIAENPENEEEIRKEFVPIKTKKVGLIDHLMIYKSKEEIDSILLVCNELKMMDRNLSFIIYFQLRRDIEDMWRDTKDKKINYKNMLPNSTFIYQTDILQQIADIVVGMVIPQIYELDTFVAVHKERNIHLKPHFVEDNDDAFVKLKGRNRIYYNFIKIRLLNSFDDPRLFCNILNPDYEEKANKIMQENIKPQVDISFPDLFKKEPPTYTPPTNLSAFEPSFKDLGSAFEDREDDSKPF
jgi:hypothetical protein